MPFWKKQKWIINPYVYIGSSILIWALMIASIVFTRTSEAFFEEANAYITDTFGWLYVGSVGFFLIFCLYLLLSKFSEFKLGDEHESPQYSFPSWMAMLFSAGMGIGLLFYGVAEPVIHYTNTPASFQALENPAARAMSMTFFHWGFHAWSIYALIGLAIAYGAFKKGRGFAVRYALYPLFGKKVEGILGDIVDTLAVVGTLFGVATSLGFGVIQINSGLEYLFDAPNETWFQVILIGFITIVATISVVAGVDKGIKRLSELNIIVALVLLLFVFFLGPTTRLLNLFIENLGSYLQYIPKVTFMTGERSGEKWMSDWTIFYWGWWIAWSPFVGMFIARISRGRTVKEFISGVLFVPTLFTFFWMTVFGETAIFLIDAGNEVLVDAVNEDISTSLFYFLENLPISGITSFIAVMVVFSFFVTSSDSGSFVIDMITSGGHPNPPTHQKIYWAFMEGLVAAILLAAGGLGALQTATINAALPFCLVLILIVIAMLKEFHQDRQDFLVREHDDLKRLHQEYVEEGKIEEIDYE
jgi:choline/glycine/proline betaine transport protein